VQTKTIYILAIESSCDDTSAAVLYNDEVLSNVVATQKIHKEYGGVVPELASRAHQQNIVPVVHQALAKANIDKKQLSAIAFTRGPGLMGSLLVGTSFAKSLALGLNIPLIEVNHMQAHLLAHFIADKDSAKPKFPFIGLTISGGHTQIVLVKDYFKMEVLGQTLDDAVGEAFDKSAKTLGLPYPGGPLIDKYASEGNPKKYEFPIPKVGELDFSFSGLKTNILYFIQKEVKKDPEFIANNLEDICASIQDTIIRTLFSKLKKLADDLDISQVAIAGGVSANSHLRSELTKLGEKKRWDTFIPEFQYCTDNAGMIAMAGYFQYLQQDFVGQEVTANPRMGF